MKGIPFRPELALAAHLEEKTETRRLVDPRKVDQIRFSPGDGESPTVAVRAVVSPPYEVGEILYVREPWRAPKELDALDAKGITERCRQAGYEQPWVPVEYADGTRRNWSSMWEQVGRQRIARFMPAFAARTLIQITEVRAEQLNKLDRAGAAAEGICYLSKIGWNQKHNDLWIIQNHRWPEENFEALWESLHGVGSWRDNPWVWVFRFERAHMAEQQMVRIA
jgi:hypothetical protein